MLRGLGLGSAEELFDSIPSDIVLKRPLDTPAALSEPELLERFEAMAAKNAAARRPSFLGAGAYSHYAPTIVDSLIQRSERFTRKTRVLVSAAVHPEYLSVAETYVAHAGIELGRLEVDEASGRTSLDAAALEKDVAAVVVQSPNFYGCVEDLSAFAEKVHAAGALLVVVVTGAASF